MRVKFQPKQYYKLVITQWSGVDPILLSFQDDLSIQSQLIPGGTALQLAGKLYLSLSALTDYCSWFVYNGLPLADCVQRFFVKLANW